MNRRKEPSEQELNEAAFCKHDDPRTQIKWGHEFTPDGPNSRNYQLDVDTRNVKYFQQIITWYSSVNKGNYNTWTKGMNGKKRIN